jgi:hypothetical protein
MHGRRTGAAAALRRPQRLSQASDLAGELMMLAYVWEHTMIAFAATLRAK